MAYLTSCGAADGVIVGKVVRGGLVENSGPIVGVGSGSGMSTMSLTDPGSSVVGDRVGVSFSGDPGDGVGNSSPSSGGWGEAGPAKMTP